MGMSLGRAGLSLAPSLDRTFEIPLPSMEHERAERPRWVRRRLREKQGPLRAHLPPAGVDMQNRLGRSVLTPDNPLRWRTVGRDRPRPRILPLRKSPSEPPARTKRVRRRRPDDASGTLVTGVGDPSEPFLQIGPNLDAPARAPAWPPPLRRPGGPGRRPVRATSPGSSAPTSRCTRSRSTRLPRPDSRTKKQDHLFAWTLRRVVLTRHAGLGVIACSDAPGRGSDRELDVGLIFKVDTRMPI